MPWTREANRRQTALVVAAGVVVVMLVAASVWVDSRSDESSVPEWVLQSAQPTAEEFSASPPKLVFASEGKLGWGLVMSGDFACRGCRSVGGRYLAVRVPRPGAKAKAIGVCETLNPCRKRVLSPPRGS
jgi:hypothetical protein